MNKLKILIPVFLFLITTSTPINAQGKLALANECFEVKAYYLATRYYQQVFSNTDKCHPDQIKLAQALAAINQKQAAEKIFQQYSYCNNMDAQANIQYGKFLMGEGAYEKAIIIFEKAATAEPDLSRHYILACQMALPKAESATPVLVKQSNLETQTTLASEKIEATNVEVQLVEDSAPAPKIADVTTTSRTVIIEQEAPPAALIVIKESETPVSTPALTPALKIEANKPTHTATKSKKVGTKKSPYGVRLGTYSSASDIPDYGNLLAYGEVSQSEWSGRTIVFLTGFDSREDAEAAVKLARTQAFSSATLVKKQASGRMKSVRD